MRTFSLILSISIGLSLQGCVTLTGVERTDLSQVKPGANRHSVETAIGEPIQATETDMGIAAVYKYSRGEVKSVFESEFAAHYALMPYLWPYGESKLREEIKALEAFLTIIYDEKGHIISVFSGNQADTFLKAAEGDGAAQYILSSNTENTPFPNREKIIERSKWVCLSANQKYWRAAYEWAQFHILGSDTEKQDLTRGML